MLNHSMLQTSVSLIRGDCLEWTSLWFCGPPVTIGPRLDMAFERYLYGPGAYSKNIRKIVAHIATQLPDDCSNIIRGVLKFILSSFKTMNATIRQNGHKKGPPRHLLLRVGTKGKTPKVGPKPPSSPRSSHAVCPSLICHTQKTSSQTFSEYYQVGQTCTLQVQGVFPLFTTIKNVGRTHPTCAGG
jgi:hypothetical protein